MECFTSGPFCGSPTAPRHQPGPQSTAWLVVRPWHLLRVTELTLPYCPSVTISQMPQGLQCPLPPISVTSTGFRKLLCTQPSPPALPHLTYSSAPGRAGVSNNGMSSGSTRSRRMDRRRAVSSSTFLGLRLEQGEHLSYRRESLHLGTDPRAQLGHRLTSAPPGPLQEGWGCFSRQ